MTLGQKNLLFFTLLLLLSLTLVIPVFAATDETPYKKEVQDFLYGLLPEDVREALQDESCYGEDMQKSYVEGAVPIRVISKGAFYCDGAKTFREKLAEKNLGPDWYWLIGESRQSVIVSSKEDNGDVSVDLITNELFNEIFFNPAHKSTYPYVSELAASIALWEQEGLPTTLTNVYVLDMTSDYGELFVCYEHGANMVIKGTWDCYAELEQYEFSEADFDYYLAEEIRIFEKQIEYHTVFYNSGIIIGGGIFVSTLPGGYGIEMKKYHQYCEELNAYYAEQAEQERLAAEAIAAEERQKQTLKLVIGCSGGALLVGAAVGAAVPTVILRRKKRIMAADGDTAEAEGV